MKVKIIVINLERSLDRRKFMELQLKDFEPEYFPAIDGQLCTLEPSAGDHVKGRVVYAHPHTDHGTTRYNFHPGTRERLSKTQVACAWSHLLLYKRLINDPDPDVGAYLILEDDTHAIVDSNTIKEYMANLPVDFDVAYLSDASRYSPIHRLVNEMVNEHYTKIKRQCFNYASSYIVSRKGAARLLTFCGDCIVMPADDVLSTAFVNKEIDVIAPTRPLFSLEHVLESTIITSSSCLEEDVPTMRKFQILHTYDKRTLPLFQHDHIDVIPSSTITVFMTVHPYDTWNNVYMTLNSAHQIATSAQLVFVNPHMVSEFSLSNVSYPVFFRSEFSLSPSTCALTLVPGDRVVVQDEPKLRSVLTQMKPVRVLRRMLYHWFLKLDTEAEAFTFFTKSDDYLRIQPSIFHIVHDRHYTYPSFEREMECVIEDETSTAYRKGVAAMALVDKPRAISEFTKVPGKSEERFWACIYLCALLDENDDAEFRVKSQLLKEASEIYPTRIEPYVRLAHMHMSRREWKQCAEVLTYVLQAPRPKLAECKYAHDESTYSYMRYHIDGVCCYYTNEPHLRERGMSSCLKAIEAHNRVVDRHNLKFYLDKLSAV